MTIALLIVSMLWAAFPAQSEPTADDWLVKRVGGDPAARTELKIDTYRAGRSAVEESLPTGYPPPTPPGAIELKRYPSVRRAEFVGMSDSDRDRNSAFFPLFRHIQQRDIAMTSPVEVDFDERSDDWTMSFLYRTPDLGPLGTFDGVEVVDTAPRVYLAIGLTGRYGDAIVERGLAALEDWIDGQSEWIRDGEARAVYQHNGPYVPDEVKWAEVQLPVTPAGAHVPAAPSPSARDIVSTSSAARQRSAQQLIELAIQRGVPLFNEGQPAACAAIYEVTAQSLLLLPQGSLDAEARSELRQALLAIENQHDPRERAWTLRHALDSTHHALALPRARAH